MKQRSIYRLLIQSEEKKRNILETALYALVALSALTAIWQFVDEPTMGTYRPGPVVKQPADARLAS
jgi:hypothetical protein